MSLPWWQRAVFYQIYPRSFADSNGDGIGDLDGITAHLDYLNDGSEKSLGIDAIWLNPINPSPLKDWGYDVSDYCGIHPELGDLDSFDRLLAEAHRRAIRVIIDFVPNHTSDRHPWFIESRSSRADPKRSWYLWVDGEPGRPPSNWLSTFGGAAWEYDPATASWYMHSFLKEQPDLNWRNPEVVAAMHEALRFWLDRGVDGFRVDAISHLVKDSSLHDNPPRTDSDLLTWRDPQGVQLHLYDQDIADTHDVVRGFRRVLDAYGERMMVGEVWPREQRSLGYYLRPDELQLAFNFRFLFCGWKAGEFRAAIAETEKILRGSAWPTYTLSNHDYPRHISRHQNRDATEARARACAVMMLGLRGTPFLYYGEEIGMPDVAIPFFAGRDPVGRDGCRTPMQWSAEKNGGFTTSDRPWLPVGNCIEVNVARQSNDPRSMLSLYRRLIRIRKQTPALTEGSYRSFSPAPDDCLAFCRELADRRVLIAINFSSEPRRIPSIEGRLLVSTIPEREDEAIRGTLALAPNEAAMVALT
ncbi:MAG: alpha-amylase family glycosyl hydrolase [Candidatus Binataceae bacterium]